MDRTTNLKKAPLSSKTRPPNPIQPLSSPTYSQTSRTHKTRDFGSPNLDVTTDLSTSLEAKERKLDEQFKSLLDRCNKSKAYIENIHKTAVADRARETSSGLLSPSSNYKTSPLNTVTKSSPYFSKQTTAHKSINDFNTTNETRSNMKYTARNSDLSYTQRNESDDYGRLESEIVDLKNTILERIKTEEKIKSKKFEESSSSSEEEEQDLPRQYTKNMSLKKVGKAENTTARSRSPIKTDDFGVGEKRKVEKNLQALKSALKEKEKITEDKMEDLKEKNQELKVVLREYVSKSIEQEEILNKKDLMLAHFEEQSRNDQEELARQMELIEELRKREELLLRSDEELREANSDLKENIAKQREKLGKVEKVIEDMENKYRAQIDKLIEENHELKTNCGVLKEREAMMKERYGELQNEVHTVRTELSSKETTLYRMGDHDQKKDDEINKLREKLELFTQENRTLVTKLEEKHKHCEELEKKVAKWKGKNDEERKKICEEKDKEIADKKEKIKHLKFRLDDFESTAVKAIEEKKLKTAEVERLLGTKAALEREVGTLREDLNQANHQLATLKVSVETLKTQNDEILKEAQAQSDKNNQLHTENKKSDKAQRSLEERLKLKEAEAQKLEEYGQKLQAEVKELLEENMKSREYILKLEGQNQYMNTRQNEEIDAVELKLDELSREMSKVKEENIALRIKDEHLVKDNETLKEERDTYKKEYKNVKQVNRALERDLQELNHRLKDVVKERKYEIEQQKEQSAQKKAQSKARVLDEIQDMIKQHRVSTRSHKLDLSGI